MASTSDPTLHRSGQHQSSEGRVDELPREECLELLAAHGLGRLAVVMGGQAPMIRPVNYLYDRPSASVVFRTAPGSKLHALRRATSATFEIDGIDHDAGMAWSVIVEGVTAEVDQPNELARLEGLGLRPWAPGPKRHWIQIRAWTISGRRIVLADDALSEGRGS